MLLPKDDRIPIFSILAVLQQKRDARKRPVLKIHLVHGKGTNLLPVRDALEAVGVNHISLFLCDIYLKNGLIELVSLRRFGFLYGVPAIGQALQPPGPGPPPCEPLHHLVW